jgi:hypothetical protein
MMMSGFPVCESNELCVFGGRVCVINCFLSSLV